MDYQKRATALLDEMIRHRRYLHRHAEVGLNLPQTASYVRAELEKLGYAPKEICPNSIVATVGTPGRTILLRADMDALPMEELSGLPFASENPEAAHTCGHDLHTAALLGAARLLKENEANLRGCVKLMFQPGEEAFLGSKPMIEAGLLENPHVDAAFASHVTPRYRTGVSAMRSGPVLASCYGFRIRITGKGSHGANPEDGVDPINIGVHLHMAFQELIAREVSYQKNAILTIGSFHAGSAPNNIPHTAELSGTLRTFHEETRKFLMERISQLVSLTAEAYRGSAQVELLSDVPVTYNDPDMAGCVHRYLEDIYGPEQVLEDVLMTGSEDFAFLCERVPCTMVFLGALDPQHTGEIFYGHHPRAVFDENALMYSAALYAHVATRWLETHSG